MGGRGKAVSSSPCFLFVKGILGPFWRQMWMLVFNPFPSMSSSYLALPHCRYLPQFPSTCPLPSPLQCASSPSQPYPLPNLAPVPLQRTESSSLHQSAILCNPKTIEPLGLRPSSAVLHGNGWQDCTAVSCAIKLVLQHAL